MHVISKINPFHKKKSNNKAEETVSNKEHSLVRSFKAFCRKGFKSEKFDALSELAIKIALSSGLTEQEMLSNWEILIICIYLEDRLAFNDPSDIPEWTSQPRLRLTNQLNKLNTTIEDSNSETSSVSSKGKVEETKPLTQPSPIIKKVISIQEVEDIVKTLNPREVFTKGVEIGRGSFGTVYVAKEKSSGKPVALKYLNLNWEENDDKKKVVNEVFLMRDCQHDNIVNFLGAYQHQNKIWITMEYCDAGTLEELIQMSISESVISHIARQVLTGIAYLHSNNRLHRDVKSANILMNYDGKVKLADLGLSIQGTGQQHKGFAGSKLWAAPEMIQRVKYNEKVDVWSFGAVLFEMAQGRPPYSQYSALKALFYTATLGAEKLKKPQKFSLEFRDLMDCCFQMDWNLRPSAQELLTHPFLQIECKTQEVEELLKTVVLMRATAGF